MIPNYPALSCHNSPFIALPHHNSPLTRIISTNLNLYRPISPYIALSHNCIHMGRLWKLIWRFVEWQSIQLEQCSRIVVNIIEIRFDIT